MKLNPNCKEVHRLISEKMDRKLTLSEKTGMRLHLLMCQACSNFSGQMDIIRAAMRKFPVDKE